VDKENRLKFNWTINGLKKHQVIDIGYTHAVGFRELITKFLIDAGGTVTEATPQDMKNSIFLIFADLQKINL